MIKAIIFDLGNVIVNFDEAPTFKKWASWLKNEGLIVFTTPDVGSIPAKIAKHRWIGFKLSDEHLTYFSPETINILCQKAGLEIVKTHHVGKYVSFSLFTERLKHYSKIASNLISALANKISPSWNFYLSAFDIICVYARKKRNRILLK